MKDLPVFIPYVPNRPLLVTVPERFSAAVETLGRVVAVGHTRYPALAVVFGLVYWRLRRAAQRVEILAQKFAAGTLRPPRPRKPRVAPPTEALPTEVLPAEAQATPAPARAPPGRPPPPRYPRQSFWLIKLLGWQAAGPGHAIRNVLASPDFAELLRAAPQLGRTLRPICHMLGIKPAPDLPPELFLPRRVRKRKPKPPPGPPPEPFVYYSAAPPIVASKHGPPDWRDTTRTHTRTMRLGSFIIERERPTKRRKNPA